MLRPLFMPVGMFALGAVSVLAWKWTSHPEVTATQAQNQSQHRITTLAVRAGDAPDSALTPTVDSPADALADTSADAAADGTPPAPPIGEGDVAKWSADALGEDPRARAAAIAALANAPRAQATPVLEKALNAAGEEERPLVLRSLRTLAQNQGDSDDRIRSVVRKVIYHESDETFTQLAQTTLDGIEQDLQPTARTSAR